MLISKLGIPVHPTLHCYENSLSNGVRYYFNSINLHKKIRPVNRLDKNTSGIVIFAKCEYIQENLKKYDKEYLAIVNGTLDGSGIIDKPIARKNNSIIERCIDENGDRAITYYEVVKNFSTADISYCSCNNNDTKNKVDKLKNVNNQKLSLVKCKLETGRTHQIRIHLASIGHPLLGDSLYGEESSLIDRQALHACKICFIHPVTEEKIEIVSEIPDDMKSILYL